MQSVTQKAGTPQAGETTINRAIDRVNLAMELRRVRDTLEELQASRHPKEHLLVFYKARLAELRGMLQIVEAAS